MVTVLHNALRFDAHLRNKFLRTALGKGMLRSNKMKLQTHCLYRVMNLRHGQMTNIITNFQSDCL